MKRQQRWAGLGFVFLLLAIGVSIYLTSHHYSLIYGMSEGKSFCNVSESVNCDAVNTSSFSEIAGLPVALLGAMAFIVELLLLLGIRAFGEEEKERIARFLFYLSVGNVLFSVYLGLASAIVLKTVCLFCASLYLLSFLILLCSYNLVTGPKFAHISDDIKSLFRSENGARGVLVLLAFIPLGSLLAQGMYKQNLPDLDHFIESSISDWQASQKFDFFTAGAPDAGNPQGKMQIVEFSDFECPHCKRAAPSLHAFVDGHRDQVHFVFQNFPLDPSCNSHAPNGAHTHACALAKGALCAQKQDKFWQAHDWIFDHQEGITDTSLDAMVGELKLDKAAFKTCLSDPAIAAAIAAGIDRGNLAGVSGTPSVYVNGKILSGGFMIPILEGALKTLK